MFLFFIPVLVGLTMMLNMCISSTMAPKVRKSEIQAMQRRLQDESSEAQGSFKASGSLEYLGFQPDVDTK